MTVDRGCASTEKWILASTREKANLDLCRDFIKEHGEVGKQILRFEWLTYKRVLQPTTANAYKPVKMKDDAYFQKLYHLDSIDEDWAQLVFDCGSVGPNPAGRNNGGVSGGVKNEYLSTVFQKQMSITRTL